MRLLFTLIVALGGIAVLSAQNPISIAQIGPVTAVTTTLPISGTVTVGALADGVDVTQGAKADARSTATDATAITIMSVLKQISFMAQTPAALPVNQSTNLAQVNGTTLLVNTGATGTGSPRVTVAVDSATVGGSATLPAGTNTIGATVAESATGAAPPAKASYIGTLQSGATGGFLGGITACDLSKPINISTATTTLIVTGVSGRQVRFCSFHMITAAANNVAWIEGTGATCGTGTAGMAGGTTAASGYNFAANAGLAIGTGLGEVLTTATTGDSACLVTSAATQLSGFAKYTIY